MTGARAAAFDFILPRIHPGWTVLDVGAGDSPLAGQIAAKGCKVLAMDRDGEALTRAWREAGGTYQIRTGFATVPGWWDGFASEFDCVIACYSLQHMIGQEPLVWQMIRRSVRPGSIFLYVGRYRAGSPQYEGDRGDPLMSGDEHTIRTLAKLTRFELVDFQRYKYSGSEFFRLPDGVGTPANAFGAEMKV